MWIAVSLKTENQICRNVLSAQKCFPLTLLRYTLLHVWKGWLAISDPTKAISQCADSFLCIHKTESPLLLSMDIRKSPAEQDMALISFYKPPNVEWGRPLNCKLEGDTAIGQGVTRFFFSTCMEKLKSGFCINFANSNVTRLFEGEPGHLVPSASHFLVESVDSPMTQAETILYRITKETCTVGTALRTSSTCLYVLWCRGPHVLRASATAHHRTDRHVLSACSNMSIRPVVRKCGSSVPRSTVSC
ncbi:hypothetical protein SKAU_G00180370 [Synaphobranchus kaupii]|uniref:Uncharacterized protein n=1 Tax=Synaphobranchus kaupii TaxID=118154 RepID=A0A9Q1FMN3_SYNKA|nr:hypothetical protein SKAU_G00180370 [Synaphobranchus kaupii]